MAGDNSKQNNVLGGDLKPCSYIPCTGFYRDGYCHTGVGDSGMHTLCAEMTETFLMFSKSRGNDLTTPQADYAFPGLKAGDRWCLSIERWMEAYDAGVAPYVVLEATHISALEYVDLVHLKAHAVKYQS